MGKDLCTSCRGKQEAERQRQADEQAAARRKQELEAAQKAARELEERTQSYVDSTMRQMRTALAQGLQPSLHTVEALSTTYALNGQMTGSPPDITRMAVYAACGWRTVAVIPQTEGTGLTNRLGNGGTVWGAGVGGLVTGVYAILELALTEAYLDANEEHVRQMIRSQYVDGVLGELLGAAFNAPTLNQGSNFMSNIAAVGLGVAGGLLVADAIGDLTAGDVGGGDGGGGDFGGFEF